MSAAPDSLFPIFLKLTGRDVLVVGAGLVGEQKVSSLLGTGARIRVVATWATTTVQQWAREGKIHYDELPFSVTDLEGAQLVIAATSDPEVNQLVFAESQQRGIWCNVVDVPPLCDFYYGALVRRGQLQIAISTAGKSPALARKLRMELEQQYGPEYGALLEELGESRQRIRASSLPAEEKKKLLFGLASRAEVDAVLAEEFAEMSEVAK
jgi:precorrin-2 dehydrogenase/sirohydrochlorin ferrochelatase